MSDFPRSGHSSPRTESDWVSPILLKNSLEPDAKKLLRCERRFLSSMRGIAAYSENPPKGLRGVEVLLMRTTFEKFPGILTALHIRVFQQIRHELPFLASRW